MHFYQCISYSMVQKSHLRYTDEKTTPDLKLHKYPSIRELKECFREIKDRLQAGVSAEGAVGRRDVFRERKEVSDITNKKLKLEEKEQTDMTGSSDGVWHKSYEDCFLLGCTIHGNRIGNGQNYVLLFPWNILSEGLLMVISDASFPVSLVLFLRHLKGGRFPWQPSG